MGCSCPRSCRTTGVFTLGTWAGALFLLLYSWSLQAQSGITFEGSVSTKEVIAGVPFELSFTLKNAEGSRFNPPALTGFKRGGISEVRGMSIINGRSSSNQSWTMELIASKPGTYVIGSATVSANGRQLSSNPITVQVIPLSASSKGQVNIPPGNDGKIFIAAEFDKKEAWVGQQLTWRIRLYTQLSVEGYDLLDLPEFEKFFTREKVRYDKRVEYLTIKGKKYAVRTLHEEAVFPQEAGEYTIPPARISVGIEQPGAQGFLFGPKPVALETQPIKLKVKSLPQTAPATFTGGVGSYEWTVTTDTSTLSTDDALTVIIEVTGNGDSRRFAAPILQTPPAFEVFEPRVMEEEEYESETEIMHRKKFEYVLLPKDTGLQTLSLSLSYFDADSSRFRDLHADSIRIRVNAGKNFKSPEDLAIPQPIAPAPSSDSFSEKINRWLQSPLLWSILALPFLALGLIAILRRKKTSNPSNPSNPSNRQGDHKQGDHKQGDHKGRPYSNQSNPPVPTFHTLTPFPPLTTLTNPSEPERFYDALFHYLQDWLGSKFRIQPAQMNESDISRILQERGASPIRIQALLSVWQLCEQAIYGGHAPAEEMESTWLLTKQVVEALEREV
ncbi:MAG: protein BatD [Saprospiraceae bacterium]|nr:protein BatD [Saprospiraceae bacterium]